MEQVIPAPFCVLNDLDAGTNFYLFCVCHHGGLEQVGIYKASSLAASAAGFGLCVSSHAEGVAAARASHGSVELRLQITYEPIAKEIACPDR
jgi:hypothetical protein